MCCLLGCSAVMLGTNWTAWP